MNRVMLFMAAGELSFIQLDENHKPIDVGKITLSELATRVPILLGYEEEDRYEYALQYIRKSDGKDLGINEYEWMTKPEAEDQLRIAKNLPFSEFNYRIASRVKEKFRGV